MKKQLFSIVGVLFTMVAVLAFVYVNNNLISNNDLLKENINALADEHSSSAGKCLAPAVYEYDNDLFEDKKNFIRCGDCIWVKGSNPPYTTC